MIGAFVDLLVDRFVPSSSNHLNALLTKNALNAHNEFEERIDLVNPDAAALLKRRLLLKVSLKKGFL